MQSGSRPIEILLVEDNPSDAELTFEVFCGSRFNNRLHIVNDGMEALDFLKQRGTYAGAVTPDVIMLDLNMPRMDGREMLAHIQDDAELRKIPIVILSGSEEDKDIAKSYRLSANCYITKPADLERFYDLVKSVEEFWLSVAGNKGKNKNEAAA